MFPARRPTTAAADRHARPALLLLACAGAGLAATDALLLHRFPLSAHIPGTGVAVGIREINGESWREGVRWLVAVGLTQAGLYALALLAVARAPLTWARRIAFGFPLLFAALLLGMYPIYATDLLHYLASARVYWVFHENALTVPPSAHHIAIGIPFADLPSPYGPLWTLFSGPAALIGADRPLAGLLALKGLAALAYAGCAVLAFLTARRLAPGHPRRAVSVVVALTWNPFVVFRMVGHGHNDSVFLFFLLLAAYLIVSERWAGVIPALIAAVLVKYVAVVLLPALVLFVVQHARAQGSWRPVWRLTFGAAHAAVAVLVAWAPFWEGTSSFALLRERNDMYTSTPGLIAFQLSQWPAVPDPAAWGRAAGATAGLCLVGLLLIRLWRGPATPERLFAVWFLTMLALLVLASPLFRPWYFLWIVGFAALLPGRGSLLLGVVIAGSVQFTDLVEQYWEFIPWVQQGFGRMLAAPVVVQFAPMSTAVLILLWRTRSLTLHAGPDIVGQTMQPVPEPLPSIAGSARAAVLPRRT